MTKSEHRTRIAIVGCGVMGREHVKNVLREPQLCEVVAMSDPSPQAYEAARQLFIQEGLQPPPNEPSMARLFETQAWDIDVAVIASPHQLHLEHARAGMEAGLDVLLEKPMVMSVQEAKELIEVRDRTARLLVISFNGSFSPQVRYAADMIGSGALGEILLISATVWEGWASSYHGHWKQDPIVSGGGFMFDTGAHMLNTVADIAGEDFREVAAWLDTRGRKPGLDITGTVMARLRSGAMVSMSACGETVPSCSSDVRVFCTRGILRTDAWGRWLELQRDGESQPAPVEGLESLGFWEIFRGARNGSIPNPCPPELGLRMAVLWDAIKASSDEQGIPVKLEGAVEELSG